MMIGTLSLVSSPTRVEEEFLLNTRGGRNKR